MKRLMPSAFMVNRNHLLYLGGRYFSPTATRAKPDAVSGGRDLKKALLVELLFFFFPDHGMILGNFENKEQNRLMRTRLYPQRSACGQTKRSAQSD
jgi:hypothetical protein